MVIDWQSIDTILLDMDGTLLDRHFDDHFWLEHVPKRYAIKNGIPLTDAKEYLYAFFKSQEQTLNWTDLDYWSEHLCLDIPILKEEVDHLIAIHPYVQEFLAFLHSHGKTIYLVTNAHSKTLELKLRKTRLGPSFCGIVSAHDLGLPKENGTFWQALQEKVPYKPARTLLAEDSETNLSTAAAFGIRYLIFISRSSSALPPQASMRFTSVNYFNELLPQAGSMTVHLP